MNVTVRHPAVAGRFYPDDPVTLLAEVQSYTTAGKEPIPALGCVVPHAGYMYSGHVAGAVYARLQIPQRCILMCPNHTGMGKPLSIMSEGAWETPMGSVPVDYEIATKLKERFSFLSEDAAAHRFEHAAEVQLPFLQACQPQVMFVPIAVGTSQFEMLDGLGHAIAEVVASREERVLIIAS